MKVLLTGGTGFLGRSVAGRLLAGGHDLRLLVRASSDVGGLPAAAERVHGDVTDPGSLTAAMAGCDTVVHAAALVKILAPARQFDRVNVEGLDNVLAASRDAGVERVLYVSSFIALGPTEELPGGAAGEEAEPLGPHGGAAGGGGRWINDYERTKTEADRRARRAIAEGAPLVVVYPGVVYGPGAMTEGNILVRHLLDLAHGRLPGLLGSPERRWSYAYVDDVAAGLVAALEGAEPGSRWVLGGDNVELGRFYELVREVGGIEVPKRRIPDAVAKTAGLLAREWARWTGGTPQITPDLVEVYRHDWALDSSAAERALGYRPRPLAEGLQATVAWLREEGAWPH
ncbi:MAG TPA: NAD-dependent epimerase/dehydratase family protein [Thermoanaerobaculia bacterium]|nr:NAD-dependent epimerase/dehydratase family protein [Thermoanaerobaculia bacterium]